MRTWARLPTSRHRQRQFFGFLYVRGDIALFGASQHGRSIKWADQWLAVGVRAALALPMFLAFPAWHWRRAITRCRWRRGVCGDSGDYLRASPDRCPECGTAPAAAMVQP